MVLANITRMSCFESHKSMVRIPNKQPSPLIPMFYCTLAVTRQTGHKKSTSWPSPDPFDMTYTLVIGVASLGSKLLRGDVQRGHRAGQYKCSCWKSLSLFTNSISVRMCVCACIRHHSNYGWCSFWCCVLTGKQYTEACSPLMLGAGSHSLNALELGGSEVRWSSARKRLVWSP